MLSHLRPRDRTPSSRQPIASWGPSGAGARNAAPLHQLGGALTLRRDPKPGGIGSRPSTVLPLAQGRPSPASATGPCPAPLRSNDSCSTEGCEAAPWFGRASSTAPWLQHATSGMPGGHSPAARDVVQDGVGTWRPRLTDDRPNGPFVPLPFELGGWFVNRGPVRKGEPHWEPAWDNAPPIADPRGTVRASAARVLVLEWHDERGAPAAVQRDWHRRPGHDEQLLPLSRAKTSQSIGSQSKLRFVTIEQLGYTSARPTCGGAAIAYDRWEGADFINVSPDVWYTNPVVIRPNVEVFGRLTGSGSVINDNVVLTASHHVEAGGLVWPELFESGMGPVRTPLNYGRWQRERDLDEAFVGGTASPSTSADWALLHMSAEIRVAQRMRLSGTTDSRLRSSEPNVKAKSGVRRADVCNLGDDRLLTKAPFGSWKSVRTSTLRVHITAATGSSGASLSMLTAGDRSRPRSVVGVVASRQPRADGSARYIEFVKVPYWRDFWVLVMDILW